MQRPLIGVSAIIARDGKMLLGQRRNSHGAGSWGTPGGHLEVGESPEDCAVREVREETGLEVSECERGPYTNDVFDLEKKHFVTLYVFCTRVSGEARLLEPDKFERWNWFGVDELPSPLFLPLRNLFAREFLPSDVRTVRDFVRGPCHR